MKRLFIALTVVTLCLPAAACPNSTTTGINTAGGVVAAAAQTEVDRAYVDFGKLISRVTVARQQGKVVSGSDTAKALADAIHDAREGLHRGDLARARSAMGRIETKLGGL